MHSANSERPCSDTLSLKMHTIICINSNKKRIFHIVFVEKIINMTSLKSFSAPYYTRSEQNDGDVVGANSDIGPALFVLALIRQTQQEHIL